MQIADISKDATTLAPGERLIEVDDGVKKKQVHLAITGRRDGNQIVHSIVATILDEAGLPTDIPIRAGEHTFMLGETDADPVVALQQAVEAEALRAHRVATQVAAWDALGIPSENSKPGGSI